MDLTTYEGIAEFSRRAAEETKRPNCDGTYSESKIDRNDVIKHHELIATACEKQIPKKPNNKRFSRNYELAEHNIMEGECPNCDDTVIGNSYGYYCGGCGQAIDWGEE